MSTYYGRVRVSAVEPAGIKITCWGAVVVLPSDTMSPEQWKMLTGIDNFDIKLAGCRVILADGSMNIAIGGRGSPGVVLTFAADSQFRADLAAALEKIDVSV